MGRRGSSELIEFLIALFVGLLAVLGAMLCIGFLLVEPLRNPPGQNVPNVEICKFHPLSHNLCMFGTKFSNSWSKLG